MMLDERNEAKLLAFTCRECMTRTTTHLRRDTRQASKTGRLRQRHAAVGNFRKGPATCAVSYVACDF
jgi:hypothetical protein